MSETQTIQNGTKEEHAQNNTITESRRGSQALQSPIKSIISRAQSLTQRSNKSNGSKNAANGSAANGPTAEGTNGTVLRIVTDGLHPGTEGGEHADAPNAHRTQEQFGGIDIKVQQLQQHSPTKHGKGLKHSLHPFDSIDSRIQQQVLLQDDDHTISVRIEGKNTFMTSDIFLQLFLNYNYYKK